MSALSKPNFISSPWKRTVTISILQETEPHWTQVASPRSHSWEASICTWTQIFLPMTAEQVLNHWSTLPQSMFVESNDAWTCSGSHSASHQLRDLQDPYLTELQLRKVSQPCQARILRYRARSLTAFHEQEKWSQPQGRAPWAGGRVKKADAALT